MSTLYGKILWWFGVVVTSLGRSTKLLYVRPVSMLGWVTVYGRVNHLGITATEVDSAFYPPWDGKMSISFRAE